MTSFNTTVIVQQQYYESKVFFPTDFFKNFSSKNKDIRDKRHRQTFLMHLECLRFYNFLFNELKLFGCTQSSTQHLPQLTIINVVVFMFYFLYSPIIS